jgi:hypothetical protein
MSVAACATHGGREQESTTAVVTPKTIESGNRRYQPEWRVIEIEKRFPGFGGYWFDSTGNLHAYTTNLRDSTKLKLELADELASWSTPTPNGQANERRIVFHEGRFSFGQLWNWRSVIARAAVETVPGFQSSSVRNSLNQVHFGVTDPKGISALQRIVASLNIPQEAVHLEVEGQICTLEARSGILVSPRDSVSGESLIAGSYFFARDGNFVDSVRVPTDWKGRIPFVPLTLERAGIYEVGIDRAGYRPWRAADVRVEKDACHVTPVTLTALLSKVSEMMPR